MITMLRSMSQKKGETKMKNNFKSKIQLSKLKTKFKKKRKHIMKYSHYKNYEDLPLFLNAELLAKVLGVAVSSAYELMHEKDFPSVRIGKRFVVPREDLKVWIENYIERKTKR